MRYHYSAYANCDGRLRYLLYIAIKEARIGNNCLIGQCLQCVRHMVQHAKPSQLFYCTGLFQEQKGIARTTTRVRDVSEDPGSLKAMCPANAKRLACSDQERTRRKMEERAIGANSRQEEVNSTISGNLCFIRPALGALFTHANTLCPQHRLGCRRLCSEARTRSGAFPLRMLVFSLGMSMWSNRWWCMNVQ